MTANVSDKSDEKQSAAQRDGEATQRQALIGHYVLHALGEPGAGHRIQVRPLWDDHFRVNVVVGTEVGAASIAHSYFLRADGDGKVLDCTPKIIKAYGASGSR